MSFFLLLLLTTCGGYDPDSTGGTGDIAFKIDWQGTPTSSKSKIRNPQSEILSYAPIDCTAIGVSIVSATVYSIHWSTTSGVTKSTGTKLTNGTSPYTHTGRTNGTTYYYVVTAVNSYGESSESSQVSGIPSTTTTSDTTAPS